MTKGLTSPTKSSQSIHVTRSVYKNHETEKYIPNDLSKNYLNRNRCIQCGGELYLIIQDDNQQ